MRFINKRSTKARETTREWICRVSSPGHSSLLPVMASLLLCILFATPLCMADVVEEADDSYPFGFPETVVTEKPGDMAVLDRYFLDEEGNRVKLVDLVDKPTLLLPVYYCCPTACILMLGGLCNLVNDIPLELGEDYRILIVSFDRDETPEDAAKAKANYTAVIKDPFPPESMRFMTGHGKDIMDVMDSIGYHFKYYEEHAYQHPNAMLALAPGGKIIRYLYGPDFLAFDIGMALTEAAKGTPSLSVRKLLTYCFDYNPETKTYTFAAVRYIVIGILIMLAIVLFFLLRRKPQKA